MKKFQFVLLISSFLSTLSFAGTLTPGNTGKTPKLWLRADKGVTQSSSLVSQWNDQSGSGNHQYQATGANKPDFQRSEANFNPTVYFSGNQWLADPDGILVTGVKEAAGLVRVEIEAQLSMGLANSPMENSELKVASGNFVVAKPIGVIDGVDYLYTGAVRKINSAAIHAQLEQNNLVLISPIGYSPSGDVFNLSAEQVATSVAIALKAEKLIFLTEESCVDSVSRQLIAQLTAQEAQTLLLKNDDLLDSLHQPLNAAIESCSAGIDRVHLLNRQIDGALLQELFTRDGVGTLISATPYEICRRATLSDIGGILELIKPLEQQGILAKRSREKIEMEINDYWIISRDGLVIGCSALHVNTKEDCAVLACLAVHVDYQGAARGQRLYDQAFEQAKNTRLSKLFVLSTQTAQWFIERGFESCALENLPNSLIALYNPLRNSRILFKTL